MTTYQTKDKHIEEVGTKCTSSNYCHYDEAHDDYIFQDEWAELIIKSINNGTLTKEMWKSKFKKRESFKMTEFETAE